MLTQVQDDETDGSLCFSRMFWTWNFYPDILDLYLTSVYIDIIGFLYIKLSTCLIVFINFLSYGPFLSLTFYLFILQFLSTWLFAIRHIFWEISASDLRQTGGPCLLRGYFCIIKWYSQACIGLVCPPARFACWGAII